MCKNISVCSEEPSVLIAARRKYILGWGFNKRLLPSLAVLSDVSSSLLNSEYSTSHMGLMPYSTDRCCITFIQNKRIIFSLLCGGSCCISLTNYIGDTKEAFVVLAACSMEFVERFTLLVLGKILRSGIHLLTLFTHLGLAKYLIIHGIC